MADSEHSALVRGLLTGFELAKSQGGAAVAVDLPLGRKLQACCPAVESEDEDSELGVAQGVSFTLSLPDGTEIRSWKSLGRWLQDVAPAQAPEAKFSACDDSASRRGSRKRMRPLEYWANERACGRKLNRLAPRTRTRACPNQTPRLYFRYGRRRLSGWPGRRRYRAQLARLVSETCIRRPTRVRVASAHEAVRTI